MPEFLKRYCFYLLLLAMMSCKNRAANFEIYGLTHHASFKGGQKNPSTFSWKIDSDNYNWTQSAYQILVAGSEHTINSNVGDFWDSGEILSGNQLFIPYSGKAFISGERYFWKVKVWEKEGNCFKWSKVDTILIPLTYPEGWKAQWITYNYKKEAPMPLLRKSFYLKKETKLSSARLYICGLGYCDAFLNGKKIGDRVLDPAQTNYDDYALYSVYDIPVNEIKKVNTLGVMPGNGWFNQYLVWSPAMAYGQPLVIAQLVIKYSNGESDTIATDDSWKWKDGPVTSNNIYAGESYDANLELTGWCKAGSDDSGWKPVKYASEYPTDIFEQMAEPIKKMEELGVKRILSPSKNTWVFDFGQNFSGWTRLKISGKKGQKITMRFSEEIGKNNDIDPASTGVFATKCVQTDQYICKGEGIEVWEPRFTYHGFRYVEVTGLEDSPAKDLLTGVVVYSSMKNSGTFSCSDPQINKLHDLALWTIKSNVTGIPSDCPHRERCGWTGDAHTIATTLIQNLDARLFLTKYLFDLRSSGRESKKELYFGVNFQDRTIETKPAGIPPMVVPGKRTSGIASPDWGTAVVQIPWLLYQYYGDIDLLREFYPDMKTWVDYISNKFPEYIVNHGLGDWCPPGGNKMIDCPVPLSSTAFHYLDLSIITKTAYLFGYRSDASFYSQRMNSVRERFNEQFFDGAKNSYGSQTANALAIQFGLVPEEKIKEVAKSLSDEITNNSTGFLTTGIFGLGRVFPVLAENGTEDLAYHLFTKTGINSFANMWENYNATTLWEVLPVDQSGVGVPRSHNHPMNGGYDEWFFRGIAGIHPDENIPGFKKMELRPYFTSKLKSAGATYESPYGLIVSNWKWIGKTFKWDIQIPANCCADIYIPKVNHKNIILVNGKPGDFNLSENPLFPGYYWYKSVGSGKYELKIDSEI